MSKHQGFFKDDVEAYVELHIHRCSRTLSYYSATLDFQQYLLETQNKFK